VLKADINLRAGGDYRFRVQSETFGQLEVHGTYREVRRPAKLVYTWNWSGDPKLEFGESVVTVDFVDRDGATEVQITHEGLPSEEIKQDHNEGWNGCLDKLEKYLGGGEETEQPVMPVGAFSWNELLTTDETAAAKFYGQVFGWQAEDFPGAGTKYSIFKNRGQRVAGLMKRPNEQCPPNWMGYVTVASADETARKVGEAGGKMLMPPFDVPTVGRIAVFQDPQGAALGIFQPLKNAGTCARNRIVWCDIPVTNLDRAIRFYSALIGAPVTKLEEHGMTFALLPHKEHEVGACLVAGGTSTEGMKPSSEGPMVYVSCQGRLNEALSAVVPNGGKVLKPKHPIGPYGSRAIVLDSEGNRIALHAT
jgi:predicted enzyme related to lactoylglutathione lyase